MKFSIAPTQVPKVYRSALISIGGFAIAIGAYFGVKALFPEYDFSEIEQMMLGAFGAFLTAFIRTLLIKE